MWIDQILCRSIINALQLKENESPKYGEYQINDDGPHWIFKPQYESNVISIDIKDEDPRNKPYPKRFLTIKMTSINVEQIKGMNDLVGYIEPKVKDDVIIIKTTFTI